ncbi:MAG TPA: 4-hydroxy-2-oxoheptanedioate aldolase [Candidatus Sulfotelmatobacter sp.]|jgi:4-hydroxy-2-oxoheptanedioate aldolase|nr:4-hydroxy-2-oxoheptanedioate aldolase [Candidatus Sulfotelmatobacter sp.]
MSSGNSFKDALARRETQIGLWLAMASPYTAEMCAGAGFDWLLLDGEHSPLDLRTTLAQMQAIAPYPSHAIIRPPVGDTVLIKQILDIGAQTLLIPMIDTAEQARQMVAATRYPPDGIRGVGAGIARASRWGNIGDYVDKANQMVCLLLQVETLTGLGNLDAIARQPGVDGVFLGAADLSASMGYLGQPSHPVVMNAMADAVRRILDAGKAPGVLCTDEAQARHFIGMGCRFVAVGVDTLLLSNATRRLARLFKGDGGAEPPAGY